MLAADELCKSMTGGSLQPGAQRSQADDLEQIHRLCYATPLIFVCLTDFEMEIAVHKSAGRVDDHCRARRGEALEPRREAGRMADWSVFSVIGGGLDGPHHHFASVDTDTHVQIDALVCTQSLGVTRISSCYQTLAIPEISDPRPMKTKKPAITSDFSTAC